MKQQQELKHLKKERVQNSRNSLVAINNHPISRFFVVFSLFFAILLNFSPIYAEKSVKIASKAHKNQQKVHYDVYAGGIHALQADLDVNLSNKSRYNLKLSAKTYGLLGKLAPWQGIFASEGWKGKANKLHKPQSHTATTIWKDEEEIKKYNYNKDGTFKTYSLKDDRNDGSPRAVDDELTQGTMDVLTATLNTMELISGKNKCEGSTEIFDGKRRYELVFNYKKDVVLKSSRWNIYDGPAIECTVEVKPIAGKWREKPRGWMSIQEQGRERGKMPTVWFASVIEGQPAVPVKVLVKTSYGTLFMHMTAYEGGDTKIAQKN